MSVAAFLLDSAAEVLMFFIKGTLMYVIHLRQKFIMRGIHIRGVEARASSATRPPCIYIKFVIDSNTDASVMLRRATLCLCGGGLELIRVDLNPDLESNGSGKFPARIKGRTNTPVELVLYPPVAWWIERNSTIELKKAAFEVESAWGSMHWSVTVAEQGPKRIEDFDQVCSSYLHALRSSLCSFDK